MQHDFEDGKYTIIFDNGMLSAMRNGEHWDRDLVGDKLVYAMLSEVDALKVKLAEAKRDADLISSACDKLRVSTSLEIRGYRHSLEEAQKLADLQRKSAIKFCDERNAARIQLAAVVEPMLRVVAALGVSSPSDKGIERLDSYAYELTEKSIRELGMEPLVTLTSARQAVTATSNVTVPKRLVDLADDFPEINMTNYGEQEVSALNNWGMELVTAVSALA